MADRISSTGLSRCANVTDDRRQIK